MDFWRSKKFKSLSLEWNKKLEDSGFVDVEKAHKNKLDTFRKSSPLEREARLEYYLLIGRLVETSNFPNELEALIMRRHAEGVTIKQILEETKKLGGIRNRKTLRYIIRRYQTKWNLKEWTPRQRNLKNPIK